MQSGYSGAVGVAVLRPSTFGVPKQQQIAVGLGDAVVGKGFSE